MLVIQKDFAEFNPSEHNWGIVWFSSFFDKPEQIYRLFGSLAQRVEKGEDIFGYIQSLTKKQKSEKFTKYFQLKPGIFGASIDVKAILEDTLIGNV